MTVNREETYVAANEEFARIRSYLVSQSAKLSVEEIMEKVEAAFDELKQSVAGPLTAAQLAFKPGTEEWNIVEVLSHITNSNAGSADTMLMLANGKEMSREGRAKLVVKLEDDLPALVQANRECVRHTVRELPGSLALEPTYMHGMFGPLNCKAWLLFIRIHNLDHAGQIRKNRDHAEFPR